MFRAYAKINLGLYVLRKRPDGYHDIGTIFHRIDLSDEIRLQTSERISVTSTVIEAPGDETNICFTAARLLQQQLGVSRGVKIEILKRIPVGAGLGGGSSDAATVLRELPHFWKRTLDPSTEQRLALMLGSDVPFFLGKSSACAAGRGEILDFFELDIPFTILLCNPNVHVSTAWAYQQLKTPGREEVLDLKSLVLAGLRDPRILVQDLRNDFEPAVCAAHPAVLGVKEEMTRRGAVYASMSGSGSSVYGFFVLHDDAVEAARKLQFAGYRTFLTPPHFSPP